MRKELQHTLLSRLRIYRLSSWLLKEVHELCCTQRVASCLHIVLIVVFSNWFSFLIARYNISAKNIINDDNSEYFSYLYLSIWILVMFYPPLFLGRCIPHFNSVLSREALLNFFGYCLCFIAVAVESRTGWRKGPIQVFQNIQYCICFHQIPDYLSLF